MSPPVSSKGKGREIDLVAPLQESSSESSNLGSSSADDSSLSDSDSDDPITPAYLEALLEEARKNVASTAAQNNRVSNGTNEEDVIVLTGERREQSLPPLGSGILPSAYFEPGSTSLRDPDVELVERATSSRLLPAPPVAPPELTKSGKPLTHKQKKKLKNKTAGPDWFDLPAPSEADLPRLYREVESLRLRNHLDPKRFYRKDEGEGKGIKGLPKYFAIGTILPSTTPFGTPSGDNLARANRKRTLVDELVDDAEAKRYAKKKFEALQGARGARGKHTLAVKKAMRQGKW